MLSLSAFNALLKIIEEPPEHLLFILATTELHKVPATILSRCQRFSFRRISQEDIAARLQYVAYQENIDLDEAAARVIARLADGGMRDGLSLLDQCASATVGELTAEAVYTCLGIAGERKCGQLLSSIAAHNTKEALQLFNQLYTDGKDLGAMLDELACLIRDLLVLKTAPGAGITMLSGVASDQEVQSLSGQLSSGELVRMMGLVQQTVADFSRSASRRMDAELCILEMAQPELSLDAKALNARLTKLEDQIKSGSFAVVQQPVAASAPAEQKPALESAVVPEMPEEVIPDDQVPLGFWAEVVAGVKQELKPPISGFLSASDNSPVKGAMRGGVLELRCTNAFTADMIGKPEVLEIVARKAAVQLGHPVKVITVDMSAKPDGNKRLDNLLQFGRQHSDIITMNE